MTFEGNEFASKGVGTAGLVTGISALALGVLNGGGGLLNGLGMNNGCGKCSEDHFVTRYEAAQEQTIAAKDSEIALLKANTYNDGKMLELYQYVDGRFRNIEQQICQQAVVNAQVTANISCMQGQIAVLNGLTKTVIPIDSICPQPAVATAA